METGSSDEEKNVLKIVCSIYDGCIDVLVDYFFRFVDIMTDTEKDQVTAIIEVRMTNERMRECAANIRNGPSSIVCQIAHSQHDRLSDLFWWNRN